MKTPRGSILSVTRLLVLLAAVLSQPPAQAETTVEAAVPIEAHLFNAQMVPLFFGDFASSRPAGAWVPSVRNASWRITDASGRFWNDAAGSFQTSAFDNTNVECVLGTFVAACPGAHIPAGVWRLTRGIDFSRFPDGDFTFTIEMTFDYFIGSESASVSRSFTVDANAPQTVVSTPGSGDPLFTTASLVISGSATDDRELSRVVVDVRDRQTGRWWDHRVNQFTSARPNHNVDVPNGSWSYAFSGGPAGSGYYRVIAKARDRSGLYDPTAAKRDFRVDTGVVDTTITAPVSNAAFLPRPVRIRGGRVVNTTGIGTLGDIVDIQIQDTADPANPRWWNGANRSWSSSPVINSGNPGKNNTWSYNFDDRNAPAQGPFLVIAQGRGGAGVVDATPAESTFSALPWPPAAVYANALGDFSFADQATVATLAIPTPANATEGDLLVLVAAASFADPVLSVGDPSWTPILQENPPPGGEGTVAAWWKPAQATPTDVLVSHADGVSRRVSALMVRVSGAWDRTAPISYAAAAGLPSAVAGGPLVEVARDRSLVLSLAYGPNASFGDTQAFHPTGFTNILTTNLNGAGSPPWLASAYLPAGTGILQPAWGGSGKTPFPFRKAVLTLVVQPYPE